jgi:hypothetical protein
MLKRHYKMKLDISQYVSMVSYISTDVEIKAKGERAKDN